MTHNAKALKGENGRGDTFFTPVCTCGWQGNAKMVPAKLSALDRISALDDAWLRASGEAKAHAEEEA